MSVLLKCMRYKIQFPENIVLNKNKRTSNIVSLHKYNPLCVVIRTTSKSKINGDSKEPRKHCKIKKEMLSVSWWRKVQIENILKTINTNDDIHPSEALILLQCCKKIFDCLPPKRLQFGEYLWSHLSICNVPLDVDHYNERLQIYLQNDYNFSPMNFLQKMKETRIEPNIATYRWCIEYYSRKGQINSIKILLDSLSDQFMLKYASTHCSLMWGYYQNGDKQAALQIFEQMDNCMKDSETYTVLMCIYAAENEMKKLENTIRSCYLQKIKLCNNNILRIIHTLAIKGHIKYIDKMMLCLKSSSPFLSDDIHIVLQLIYSNQMDVVLKILSHIKDESISRLCIQNLVYLSTDFDAISKMCNSFASAGLCRDPLLWALYYSYFRNDDLCLSLLKICKYDYKIKPHYFWPLLTKKEEMYDLKGLLDVLKIMINDFNVTPCVNTISNYVLTCMVDNVHLSRTVLIDCGISSIIVDNAVVLMWLKNLKTANAGYYVRSYHGPYMYNEIAYDVRKALFSVNDLKNLIYIYTQLLEGDESHTDTIFNEKAIKTMTCVPLEKLVLDLIADYPKKKIFIKMVIRYLAKKGLKISYNTVRTVSHNFGNSNVEL